MKKVFVVLLAVLIAAGMVLGGCAGTATTTSPASTTAAQVKVSTPQSGGVLRILATAEVTAFGVPWTLVGPQLKWVFPAIESLLTFDEEGRVIGALAAGYEIAADGKYIQFNLRKGVKFHDGTDCDAQAIKWNLEHYKAGKPTAVPNWQSVEIINDQTIRLNLSKITNEILSQFTGEIGAIISPSAFEKNGLEWAKYNAIGTGPFKFKSFVPLTSLEFERFDNYWGNKAYLDGIKYSFIADPMTASMALQVGDGDVLILEALQVMGPDLEAKGFKIELAKVGIFVLSPDSKSPSSPFADKRVREALEYAIDRESIAKTLGKGYLEAVYQASPPWTIGYIPDLKGRMYDQVKAKQLLTEAGYPNGFKTFITLQETQDRNPLLSVQANLKSVGIDAELNIVTPAKYNDFWQGKGGNVGLLYVNQGSPTGNTSSFLNSYYGKTSARVPDLLRPAKLMEVASQGILALDFNSQKASAQEVTRLIFDDAVVIPCWSFVNGYVKTTKVNDTNFGKFPSASFWTYGKAWLSK